MWRAKVVTSYSYIHKRIKLKFWNSLSIFILIYSLWFNIGVIVEFTRCNWRWKLLQGVYIYWFYSLLHNTTHTICCFGGLIFLWVARKMNIFILESLDSIVFAPVAQCWINRGCCCLFGGALRALKKWGRRRQIVTYPHVF